MLAAKIFQCKENRFDPIERGNSLLIIQLLMRIIMAHDFTVDTTHKVIWIALEDNHAAQYEVFTGP